MKKLLCDVCGKPIETAGEGWIEWRECFLPEKDTHYSYNAVIVHKGTDCQTAVKYGRNPRTMNDLWLKMCVYPKGIESLREHFQETKLPKKETEVIIQRITSFLGEGKHNDKRRNSSSRR